MKEGTDQDLNSRTLKTNELGRTKSVGVANTRRIDNDATDEPSPLVIKSSISLQNLKSEDDSCSLDELPLIEMDTEEFSETDSQEALIPDPLATMEQVIGIPEHRQSQTVQFVTENDTTYATGDLSPGSDNHPNIACQVCGKMIRRKNKAVHMRVHTGEKPYECEICGKKFSQKNSLTIHKKIHTGGFPTCSLCQKKFQRKALLNVHLQNVHGIVTLE